MNERVLWRNAQLKGCPWCWYSEGANMNLLRNHLLDHHRALVIAYSASQGIGDLEKAAWRLVDEAQMPRIPPHIERLDEKSALITKFILGRD